MADSLIHDHKTSTTQSGEQEITNFFFFFFSSRALKFNCDSLRVQSAFPVKDHKTPTRNFVNSHSGFRISSGLRISSGFRISSSDRDSDSGPYNAKNGEQDAAPCVRHRIFGSSIRIIFSLRIGSSLRIVSSLRIGSSLRISSSDRDSDSGP